MSKFNRTPSSPITAAPTSTILTHEGGQAYTRDTKSDLFLLAVSNMVGETTFYENAETRDARYRALVRTVAVSDPAWTVGFIGWLRGTANMRSASLVAAAETVKARTDHGLHGHSRQAVAAACRRADEPGELLAYWLARYSTRNTEGRGLTLPKPLRRGLTDAVARLYDEYTFAKYDTGTVRFGDVIDLIKPAHPTHGALYAAHRGTPVGDLYRHALNVRHGRHAPIPDTLPMLRARADLLALPLAERRAFLERPDAFTRLRAAGLTWEALAGWLQGPLDAAAWKAVIPWMGYMALLRNLRNFENVGLDEDEATGEMIAKTLADPQRVAASRQLPFRFLTAYLHTTSDRWKTPLEQALQHSLANIPALPGRTLILVDTSASMTGHPISRNSGIYAAMAGALFGVALAAKGEAADLHGFADGVFLHRVEPGAPVLREVQRFCGRIGAVGHGTRVWSSVAAAYEGHDRIVIISDEQAFGRTYGENATSAVVPDGVPVYAYNLGGYAPSLIPSGAPNRHSLGGFSDAAFRLMQLLEAGEDATWPWQQKAAT